MNLDEALLRAARTRGHSPQAEHAVARFSQIGEHAAVWLAIGAVGWAVDRKRRPEWRSALGAVAGTYALNTSLKLLIRRKRPQLDGLPPLTDTPTQLSFPSAHASTSFAGARAYSQLGLAAAPLYGLALSLCASRLYLGVHYPSDVAGGAVLGDRVSWMFMGRSRTETTR